MNIILIIYNINFYKNTYLQHEKIVKKYQPSR